VFLISVGPAVAFATAGFFVGGQFKLYFGFVAGAFLALFMWVRDSPPPYIEKWRSGSDGERRTARALRPLEREGWRVWHDITREAGTNFDHVVVGPSGVFLLDTKNYLGLASIESGELRVRWLEDPDDGWICAGLGRRMRGASVEFKERIEAMTGVRVWVHPVVVLWQLFPQCVVEIPTPSSVFFVQGDRLVSWLRERPPRSRFDPQRFGALWDEAVRSRDTSRERST
jgi:hypothetical protein